MDGGWDGKAHRGIQVADMGKLPLQAEKGVRFWWLLLEESVEGMAGCMQKTLNAC
jgi:hypothetical protein